MSVGQNLPHIRMDDLQGASILDLLREHKQHMVDTSPEDAMHTLDIDRLRAPDITMWSAWDGNELLGCCALKEIDDSCGELKSMRTATAHLGKGVATDLLQHIIVAAKGRGYTHLYLETGSSPAFTPAHTLYQKSGFQFRGPFANYREDPVSRFMQLEL